MPQTLQEMADPAWAGRFMITRGGNSSMVTHVAALRLMWGDDATRGWLSAVKDQAGAITGGHTDIRQAVGAGEFEFGLVNNYYYHLQLEESTTNNVGAVYPDQGADGDGRRGNPGGPLYPLRLRSGCNAALYYQMGSFDRLSAAVLSVALILLTLILLWLEYGTRRRQRFVQGNAACSNITPVPLGRGRIPALAAFVTVTFFALVLPLAVLLSWSYTGITGGATDSRFWIYAHQSLITAGLAALACAVLALPGVIIALGMVFTFNQYLPGLYGTPVVLVLAYIIRFLPQAMQAESSSLSQVSPRLDEAGRSLGFSPRRVISGIILTLIRPGILAGMALVFVSAIKELPATLVLRPPGMDTLAVRIWIEASEGFYEMAAPAALLIILISALPLKWLINKF